MGCSPSKDLNPNAARGYLLENFDRHKGGINCMSMSEDHSMLATGGEDATVKLWRTNPVAYVGSLDGHTGYVCCCLIHGQYVLSGASDNTVRKWCVTSRQCLYVYEGHTARVSRILCTGDFIFSTSDDKTARAWLFDVKRDTDKKVACKRVFEGHAKPIYPLAFIPAEDNPLTGMSICADDVLITGSSDKTAKSWSFQTGKILKTFKGHKGPINCMAVDGEAKHLFTGSGDTVIRCWNIKTGNCLREMKGHMGAILQILVHNRMLYSCSVDQTARAWVTEIGECSKIYRGHTQTVCCLRYHDGFVFTGCGDSVGRMYKAKTGECKRAFKGHTNTLIAMEVTEERLFTVSYDGTLRVWDTTGILDEDITMEEQIQAIEAKELGQKQMPSKSMDPYCETIEEI